jgi:hypothetical protein
VKLASTESTPVFNTSTEIDSPLLLESSDNDKAKSASIGSCGNIGQAQIYQREVPHSLKDIATEESTLSPCPITRSVFAAQMSQQLQSYVNTRNQKISQMVASRARIYQYSKKQQPVKVLFSILLMILLLNFSFRHLGQKRKRSQIWKTAVIKLKILLNNWLVKSIHVVLNILVYISLHKHASYTTMCWYTFILVWCIFCNAYLMLYWVFFFN